MKSNILSYTAHLDDVANAIAADSRELARVCIESVLPETSDRAETWLIQAWTCDSLREAEIAIQQALEIDSHNEIALAGLSWIRGIQDVADLQLEAKQRAEEEARRKEEEARRQAEEEARRQAEEAARLEAEEEARRQAEEAARLEAEEEARRQAEEAARLEAEEEARRQAEEAARLEAEEEARRQAEEAARLEAEEEARRQAEEAARLEAEEEARRQAEEAARLEAEEEARRQAEEAARLEAEEEARRQAEEEARLEAEEEARRQAEEEARLEAEEEVRRQAEEEARLEAEEEVRRQAEEEARLEAEEEVRRQAEEEAQREADEESRRQAELEEREELERQADAGTEAAARRLGEGEPQRDLACFANDGDRDMMAAELIDTVETLTSEIHQELRSVGNEGECSTQSDVDSHSQTVVLAVDDSPTVRKLVSLTLSSEGYEVVTAADGIEALNILSEQLPDIILSDINMPKLNGYKLCKFVKKHERTKSIPVVMLSGKDGVFDKMRGKMSGCDDFIAKPFESAELVAKVRENLVAAARC